MLNIGLTEFNSDFAAKVQWCIDNIAWSNDLDAQDIARFATAIVLNNCNVRVYDNNGDIMAIVK